MEGMVSEFRLEAGGLGRALEGCGVAGCRRLVGEVGDEVVGGERCRRS